MVTDATVEAADRAARIWAAAEPGPIVPGSEAHKRAFCRMLLDTHNPYKPSIIDWPPLDREARDRLVGLPIWDIAVQTEGKARLRVLSYAETVADPLLRQAIELDGFEEGRHKQVLVQSGRGLRHPPRRRNPIICARATPNGRSWSPASASASTASSPLACSRWPSARASFRPALVETFEPVMQEEGRHILFFVNWVAWHRRRLPWWRRPWFAIKTLAVWAFLIWERIGIARGVGKGEAAGALETPQDNNFTMTGSKSLGAVDLSAAALIDICLAENDRRLSGYDPRLLRPNVVPRLMRFARRLMRFARRLARWRGNPVSAP